jgi:hypothetical protein
MSGHNSPGSGSGIRIVASAVPGLFQTRIGLSCASGFCSVPLKPSKLADLSYSLPRRQSNERFSSIKTTMWSMFCSCPIFFGLAPSKWIRLHQGYPDWASEGGSRLRNNAWLAGCKAWSCPPDAAKPNGPTGQVCAKFPAIENNLPCFLSGNSLFVNSGKDGRKTESSGTFERLPSFEWGMAGEFPCIFPC